MALAETGFGSAAIAPPMTSSIHVNLDLGTIDCCSCGLIFAVPNDWIARRRQDHTQFYCPNGHPQGFMAENEAEKLRRELDRAKQRGAMLEQDAIEANERARAAERAHAALQRRVHAGVCPDCRRSFVNLRRHMAHKHAPKIRLVAS